MDISANDQLIDLISAACQAGADFAEGVLSGSETTSISVRQGKLEGVEHDEPFYCGLRVWLGARSASLSSAGLSSKSGRDRLIDRALAIAKAAPEDRFARLAIADSGRLFASTTAEDSLQLFDPTQPSVEDLRARARDAEDAVLATPGVTKSGGASASCSSAWRWHATSRGFLGFRRRSGFSLGASALAGDGPTMQTDGFGLGARWWSDLPLASEIGAEAGRRAVAKLNPRKISSIRAPVIFERRIALELIAPFIGAISGPTVVRRCSFLQDQLGEQVFSASIQIRDQPDRVRGLGSRLFDDEGMITRPRALIEDGVLTTWLLNAASAAELGLEPNGYAGRGGVGPAGVTLSNMTLAAGSDTLAELMGQVRSGLLVTGMFGPSLNANTGEWSAGVNGVWFEDGEPAYPVSEVTVAGSLRDFYARMIPASDLEILGSANAPSVLIDAVAIAGR